jgi:hypothetical protein
MRRFCILLKMIIMMTSVAVFGQNGSHSDDSRVTDLSALLKDELHFTRSSHEELLPNSEKPSLSIHRENGLITFNNDQKVKAVWVYRGIKGKPNGDLDLIAVEAGKAKTFQAARATCAKLTPLGEWRLVNVVHVMAFFSDMLPAYPMWDRPQAKGRFFWSTSLNEKQDKKNKDDFFSANEGTEEQFQVLGYKKFIQWVTASETHSKSAEEKAYFKRLLKETEAGIPVICIQGKEPKP